MSEAADTLRTVSDVLRLVGTAAPEPVGVAARVLSAAAGALSVLFDEGLDEAQAIAAIHRVTRIDTRAVDAAADARIAARREAERTERGDEPTRETPTVSTVSINGVPMAVQIGAPLTYEAIVDEMARRGKRRGLYTVAWSMPRGPSGVLSPGQSVVAQIGMRMSADITDGA